MYSWKPRATLLPSAEAASMLAVLPVARVAAPSSLVRGLQELAACFAAALARRGAKLWASRFMSSKLSDCGGGCVRAMCGMSEPVLVGSIHLVDVRLQ